MGGRFKMYYNIVFSSKIVLNRSTDVILLLVGVKDIGLMLCAYINMTV